MFPLRLTALLGCLWAPSLAFAQTAAPPMSPWTGAELPPPPPPSALPPAPPRTRPQAPAVDTDLTDTNRLARLSSVLQWHDDLDSSRRTAVTIAGGIAGGAMLATGLVLTQRSVSIDPTYGVMVGGAGLGALIGIGIGALVPSSWAPITTVLREGRERHDSPAQIVAATEAAWREHAERNRRVRRVAGVGLCILGGLSLVAGSVFLLVESTSRSKREAYRAGGAGLSILGLSTGIAGASVLFSAGPVEQGWETWHRSTSPTLAFGVSPVEGGAMAGLGGSF